MMKISSVVDDKSAGELCNDLALIIQACDDKLDDSIVLRLVALGGGVLRLPEVDHTASEIRECGDSVVPSASSLQ
jgi:hypothetical protein